MSQENTTRSEPEICDHCGVTKRTDCIKGYATSGPELMCENLLINLRIAASLRAAGLLGDQDD